MFDCPLYSTLGVVKCVTPGVDRTRRQVRPNRQERLSRAKAPQAAYCANGTPSSEASVRTIVNAARRSAQCHIVFAETAGVMRGGGESVADEAIEEATFGIGG
jgi:hypothetical protein